MAVLNAREKFLYHQIHPAKIAVDWACGMFSLIPLWNHQLVLGLIIAFVPSVLISRLILQLADLSHFRTSSFGRYMMTHMSGWLQFVRIFGFIIMLFGAWHHDVLLIATGISMILLAWLNGFFRSAVNRQLSQTYHRDAHGH